MALGNVLQVTSVNQYVQQLLADFAKRKWIYGFLLFYWALAVSASSYTGKPLTDGIFQELIGFLFSSTVLGVCTLSILSLVAVKLYQLFSAKFEGSLLVEYRGWFYERFLRPVPLSRFVHTLFVIYLLAVPFTFLKSLVPYADGFIWDKTLMAWDKFLFFGSLPHEWFLPAFGHSWALATFNFAYNLWFFILYGVFFVIALRQKNESDGLRFLFSTVLTWALVGNLLAILLPSAGPCFWEQMFGPGHIYSSLMEHLVKVNESVPIFALNTQTQLWTEYSKVQGPESMISAMPSMHVASSLLMMLYARSLNKISNYCMTVFFGLICMGSVVLAWHYAVDGVVGAFVAYLLWRLAGAVYPTKQTR